MVLFSPPVFCEPLADPGKHFSDGVQRAQRGELAAAVEEFEQAYRLSPNYAVLYNLGQAYVALGRPVEAVAALEKYLELGGTRIAEARRQRISALITLSKEKIGLATFRVSEAGAVVVVDGTPVGTSPLPEPIALTVGSHTVTVEGAGFAPFVGHVDVVAGVTSAMDLELHHAPQPVARGLVLLESSVPAFKIRLDGEPRAVEPRDHLLVPIGAHEVTCFRDGYTPTVTRIDVTEGSPSRVRCNLSTRRDLPAWQTGTIALRISEPYSEVHIDGRSATATSRLPTGPHHVRVRRAGFQDWARIVTVRPGSLHTIYPHLLPTPERAAADSRARKSRRTWAYGFGISGLSLIGASAVVYAANAHRYSEWKTERNSLSHDILIGSATPTLNMRVNHLNEGAASIQAYDDVALGVAVIGAGLLSYALASWLTVEHE